MPCTNGANSVEKVLASLVGNCHLLFTVFILLFNKSLWAFQKLDWVAARFKTRHFLTLKCGGADHECKRVQLQEHLMISEREIGSLCFYLCAFIILVYCT